MALYFDKQMTPDLEEYDAIACSAAYWMRRYNPSKERVTPQNPAIRYFGMNANLYTGK